MANRTRLIVVIILLGAAAGGGYFLYTQQFTQGIQQPELTVEDIGDWGTVTDTQITVIHTLNLYNPNPASVNISGATTVRVRLQMNGVDLASISKSGLSIDQGNNTVPVTTTLQQDRLGEFWARFINNDETIKATLFPTIEVQAGPGFSVSTPPVHRTALSDRQPVSAALNRTGNNFEGTYTIANVDQSRIDTRYLPSGLVGPATVEYTVEAVRFEWGEVTADRTTLLIHLRLRNTGDVILPGVPDGIATDILLNGIEVFHARSEAIAVQNIDRDAVIPPGQTKSYTLVARADNQHVEQWLTTYARRGEHSSVTTEFQLAFDIGDVTLVAPANGAVTYDCRFQTGVFVDEQETATTCGTNGSVSVGPVQLTDVPGSGSDGSGTATATETPTPTASPGTTESEPAAPPKARLDAEPTSGDAPLPVEFDASASADPDGEITQYIWRFKDGTPPGSGVFCLTHVPDAR